MRKALLAAPLLAAGLLSACSGGSVGTVDAAKTGGALCAEAFKHQQVATDFKPASEQAAAVKVDSLLGVGTAKDGICLTTSTEEYVKGWRIASITTAVTPLRTDQATTFAYSRSVKQSAEEEPFFVPLDDCARVMGVLTMEQEGTTKQVTWQATGVYGPAGVNCRKRAATADK